MGSSVFIRNSCRTVISAKFYLSLASMLKLISFTTEVSAGQK